MVAERSHQHAVFRLILSFLDQPRFESRLGHGTVYIAIAAVWCSAVMARLRWGGSWVLVDGQAGPCMASVHGAGWV